MSPRDSNTGALGVFFQKSFWNEMGRSAKRAHKDRRARKRIFGVLILLLVPLLAIAYLAFLMGSGAWLFVPIIIPVMWWRVRQANRDSQPMRVAPETDPPQKPTEEALAKVRKYFAEMALIYAVLLDRAGSERFVREQELGPGIEITSRRVHIGVLKQHSLWDRMAAADRDLVMLPDGHWPHETINRIQTGIEPLRLLRWVLRIDFRLPHVGQQLYGDLSIAHELVAEPGNLLEGNLLVDADMVRIARDDASVFRSRCLAEAISRGYTAPQDENTTKWAEGVSRNFRGRQSEDLVLGDKLVSESERGQLEWAGLLAFIRCEFLNEVVAILESGHTPAPPLATTFAREAELESQEGARSA